MKKNWGYPYRTPKREDITPHGWQLKNDEEEWEEVGKIKRTNPKTAI